MVQMGTMEAAELLLLMQLMLPALPMLPVPLPLLFLLPTSLPHENEAGLKGPSRRERIIKVLRESKRLLHSNQSQEQQQWQRQSWIMARAVLP